MTAYNKLAIDVQNALLDEGITDDNHYLVYLLSMFTREWNKRPVDRCSMLVAKHHNAMSEGYNHFRAQRHERKLRLDDARQTLPPMLEPKTMDVTGLVHDHAIVKAVEKFVKQSDNNADYRGIMFVANSNQYDQWFNAVWQMLESIGGKAFRPGQGRCIFNLINGSVLVLEIAHGNMAYNMRGSDWQYFAIAHNVQLDIYNRDILAELMDRAANRNQESFVYIRVEA